MKFNIWWGLNDNEETKPIEANSLALELKSNNISHICKNFLHEDTLDIHIIKRPSVIYIDSCKQLWIDKSYDINDCKIVWQQNKPL